MKLNGAEFMLSLSAKAGKAVSGETSVEKAVRAGKAHIVIVSSDASDNTKKKFRNKCSFYEIPIYIYGTKESLAHAIGKDVRSSVAVTDRGLAGQIIKKLNELDVKPETGDVQ